MGPALDGELYVSLRAIDNDSMLNGNVRKANVMEQ